MRFRKFSLYCQTSGMEELWLIFGRQSLEMVISFGYFSCYLFSKQHVIHFKLDIICSSSYSSFMKILNLVLCPVIWLCFELGIHFSPDALFSPMPSV